MRNCHKGCNTLCFSFGVAVVVFRWLLLSQLFCVAFLWLVSSFILPLGRSLHGAVAGKQHVRRDLLKAVGVNGAHLSLIENITGAANAQCGVRGKMQTFA